MGCCVAGKDETIFDKLPQGLEKAEVASFDEVNKNIN
jgi:hypothetical protein